MKVDLSVDLVVITCQLLLLLPVDLSVDLVVITCQLLLLLQPLPVNYSYFCNHLIQLTSTFQIAYFISKSATCAFIVNLELHELFDKIHGISDLCWKEIE